MMKLEKNLIRRKKLAVSVVSWTGFFWFTILLVLALSSFLISLKKISTVSSFHFLSRHRDGPDGLDDHQKLVASAWPNLVMEATMEPSATTTPTTTATIPKVTILHAVEFPDEIAFFLNNNPPPLLESSSDVDCVYLSSNSSSTIKLRLPPIHHDFNDPRKQVTVRCPVPQPREFSTTVAGVRLKNPNLVLIPPVSYRWDWLTYESFFDENDNTTIVFAKGLNLLRGRLYNPSRFSCIFSQDDPTKTSLFHRSKVLSIGQEVIRCETPLQLLISQTMNNKLIDHHHAVKVSVRLNGRATLPSIATPLPMVVPPQLHPHPHKKEKEEEVAPKHEMCVCTMVRNQARFLKEWITYHSHIGVTRWFIYDNNSDDDTPSIISSLSSAYNISIHRWPWIKSQEAGFAHCALQSRTHCKWVAFIDVDEFFHFPTSSLTTTPPSLLAVVRDQAPTTVGEIRTFCYSFGPSGHRKLPPHGVTVAYTCRMRTHERHKSIIRPEALSYDLMNVVHHFRLRDGFRSVTLDRPVMVINHYKYQVWDVFKHKFYRRVATYVSDWKDEVNTGSKDRAPGLGTKAVEPDDWATRFCDVNDTKLRDEVMRVFVMNSPSDLDSNRVLPWE